MRCPKPAIPDRKPEVAEAELVSIPNFYFCLKKRLFSFLAEMEEVG